MFRKNLVIFWLFISCLYVAQVHAGEITDKEWNVLGNLVVTYFKGTRSTNFPDFAECTAFNSQNKPIGGGKGLVEGGVARVYVTVPKKYQGKELRVDCR